jgi:ribonuclease D
MWPHLSKATQLEEDDLPKPAGPGDGPPPPSRWADRDPAAADRLMRTRAAVTAVAEEHGLPVENLLSPDLVRRLTWSPPEPTREAVAATLTAGGARSWQVELTAGVLADALVDVEPAEQIAD